jgi:hypothetical protein
MMSQIALTKLESDWVDAMALGCFFLVVFSALIISL